MCRSRRLECVLNAARRPVLHQLYIPPKAHSQAASLRCIQLTRRALSQRTTGLFISHENCGIYCPAYLAPSLASSRDTALPTGESHEHPCRLEVSFRDVGVVRGKRRGARGRSASQGQEGGRTGGRHRNAVRAVRLPRERPAGRLQQGSVRRGRQGTRREGALHRPAVAERAARVSKRASSTWSAAR